jgi:hypothetical protein
MATESIDFSVCGQAGIGASDLSRLADVSRTTASLWLNDHAGPHVLHYTRIAALVDCIRTAVAAGALPIPADTMRRDRENVILNILIDHGLDS